MNHAEVKQHVIDTLGKILVDKSLIQEEDDALLTELVLDEDDYKEFFSTLQTDFNIELPQQIKSDISRLPDHATYHQLTLQGLVDLIFTHMKRKKNH